MTLRLPGRARTQQRRRVLCVGDSLTNVYDLSFPQDSGYDHYVPHLQEYSDEPLEFCGSVYVPGENHRDEGHSGYTTASILAGLPGWVTSAGYPAPPTIAPLLISMNDAAVGGLSLEQTRTNLVAIRAWFAGQYPFCRVPVCTLPPVSGVGLYADRLAHVALVNPMIRANFDDVIELERDDFDPVADTVDGLHHRTSGARKIARYVAEGLGWRQRTD